MKSVQVALLLLAVFAAPGGHSTDETPPSAAVRLEEAVQASISSLRNGNLLRREEFRLTVRRDGENWVLWFEFIPHVYGEDVTVIVDRHRETTVLPGL